MKNYRIEIQYDGSKYSGWQKQENTSNTIQGKLEHILSVMCRSDVEVNGAGRTDAGVHAKMQVANFKCETTFTEGEIMDYINEYLPEDVRVSNIEQVDMRFHARLNAKGKHYRYSIDTNQPYSVFSKNFAESIVCELDIEAMRRASRVFVGKHDFISFCDNKHMKKSSVRTINKIKINEEDGMIYLDFYGDGFLYHMVRKISYALIEVGLGNTDENILGEILDSKSAAAYKGLAKAKGLCLMEVFY